MNGADVLIQTAVNAGVDVCFANPGTTEMPLVSALDNVDGIRGVLGLFEGVCTGAADGYGRMKEKPAMTLLHLGPGFANGLANLHNARRAGTPLINVIGEHATWHLPADPPLAMEIAALSGTVSGWHRTVGALGDLSRDTAKAFEAAMAGQIATLVVPHDFQWSAADGQGIVSTEIRTPRFDARAVEHAADLLKANKRTALVLGGPALTRKGLMTAARIRSATGCDLVCETFPARVDRGAGLPDVAKLPYLPEMALEVLKHYDVLIMAGAREPVAFFGYEGSVSRLISDSQRTARIGDHRRNIIYALEALSESVGADRSGEPELARPGRPEMPTGKLDSNKVCTVLAAMQPEKAIIVEEAITSGMGYFAQAAGCPPFTYLTVTGGAIGHGPPCSVGAAVACPDRPVINFQADGSAMYTVQSLWTQARENLNITTLVCNNRSYDILKMEQARAQTGEPGPYGRKLTDLDGIDWVKMGEAQGVSSVAADTVEALVPAIEKALKEDGPHLIEMQLF